MNYSVIKLIVYMLSMLPVMYGLHCINFEKWIRKGRITQFYTLYMVLVFVLTYILGQFVLDIMTIRFF